MAIANTNTSFRGTGRTIEEIARAEELKKQEQEARDIEKAMRDSELEK